MCSGTDPAFAVERKTEMKMFRVLSGLGAATAVALLVVATSLGGSQAAPTVRGTVGPGFTIKLTKSGKVVKTLVPGTYKFVVDDRSAAHNFVLERQGGGERRLTSVPFVGVKTVAVKLTKGVWKFYCEPHASMMFGRVSVGGATLSRSVSTPRVDD